MKRNRYIYFTIWKIITMKATKLIINWEEQTIAWWDSMPWVATLEYRRIIDDVQAKATQAYNWYLVSWTLEDGTILVLYNYYDGNVDATGEILDISGQDIIYISNVVPWYVVGDNGAATWLLRNIEWEWVIFPRRGVWGPDK